MEALEYREKIGGRCWTLRGGDSYTELGGATQDVDFTTGKAAFAVEELDEVNRR